MALGLDDYGSGSDSEPENTVSQAGSSQFAPSAKAPAPVPLPSSPKLAPKSKPTKKLKIGLPALKPVNDSDNSDDEPPPAKKPRLKTGAGRSSLLDMLPAPKQKLSPSVAPQKVLGGGQGNAFAFEARTKSATSSDSVSVPALDDNAAEAEPKMDTHDPDDVTAKAPKASIPFMPTSVRRGKANVSVEEYGMARPSSSKAPTVSAALSIDFFSLTDQKASSSASSNGAPNTVSSSSTPTVRTVPSLPSVLSAPDVPKFELPEPTPNDPYPGYYQLPSGTWAAYETAYYEKFVKKWRDEYDAYVRALEKGQRGFEDLDRSNVAEVDAAKEMERAQALVRDHEERKALTRGVDAGEEKPKMNITASKLSGIARSRHQLATMLHEAYSNREALEEKIAEGRRNRKEAGNKYGF
ncbi:hypothetical protein FISHEDRAFT_62480 [Fistulina hepatica ATCC 64428]|nr:hypothetical protein FISHEDRAFT_62480 [Fistulina hepatica ATCC 64428]